MMMMPLICSKLKPVGRAVARATRNSPRKTRPPSRHGAAGAMERVTADASTLSLLPLEDVDSMLQRATVDGALAVQLPKHFKCRLKDIRTQCGGGQRPAEFKFDVAECWMAYFPGTLRRRGATAAL